MMNLTKKGPLFTRLHRSNSSYNESVTNSALSTAYPTIRRPSSMNLSSKLSDTTTVLTDSDRHSNLSAVSVKKVTPSELANMSNIQKFNEDKTKGNDNSNNDSLNRPTTVNVVRVRRIPNPNTTDEDNLTIRDTSSATSKKTNRVMVTKLPRDKSRSASLTRVHQPPIEMQPIPGPAKDSGASINNPQVKVTKVSRRIATTQSSSK